MKLKTKRPLLKQMQYRAPKHKPIDTLHSILRRGNFIPN